MSRQILASVIPLVVAALFASPVLAQPSVKASSAAQRATPPTAKASPAKKQRTRRRHRWHRRRVADNRMVVSSPGFRMLRNGSSVLYVQVLGVPAIQQVKAPGRLIITIPNSKVPVHNNRRILRTRYFNTPIADARLKQLKESVQVIIDLRSTTAAKVSLRPIVQGKVSLLEVVFPPGHYYVRRDDVLPVRGRRARSTRGGTVPSHHRSRRRPATVPGSNRSVMGPPSP